MIPQTKLLLKKLKLLLKDTGLDQSLIISKKRFDEFNLSSTEKKRLIISCIKEAAYKLLPGTKIKLIKDLDVRGEAFVELKIINLDNRFLTKTAIKLDYNVSLFISTFCHEMGHLLQWDLMQPENNPLFDKKTLKKQFDLEEEADKLGNVIAKKLFPGFCDHKTWFQAYNRKSVPDKQFLALWAKSNPKDYRKN